MPAAVLIASAGATAFQVFGQIKAGRAAKKAGEAEAQRDEFNASVADLQSQDAIARGAEEESAYRTQVRGLIGSQRAAFAAGNVDVGSGSAADVQADSAYLGELDAQRIRANAAREAWGYQAQAQDYRMAAATARAGGQAQQTAAYLGAAGTAATGASSILFTRYQMRRTSPGPAPRS